MASPHLSSLITFDKVQVRCSFRSQRVESISISNEGIVVAIVPSVLNNRQTFDPNSAPFIVARDALSGGTAVLEYLIGGLGDAITSLDSALPDHLHVVRSWDPLRKAYLAQARAPSNVGPANLILYKYIEVPAGDPEPSAPALPTDPFDGDVEDLQDHYEALGWYLHTHDAMTNMPTGSPSLYYLVVNYFWDGGTSVGELSVAEPVTGGVQFYYDGMWNFAPPSDDTLIERIQITIGGESVEITVGTLQELITPIEVLLASNFIPNSAAGYPHVIALNTGQLDDLYALQIRGHVVTDPTNQHPIYGDDSHIIPLDEIYPIYPCQIAWDEVASQFDFIEPYSGQNGINYYAVGVNKKGGRMEYGVANSDNLQLSYGSGSWVSFLLGWEFYPKTILTEDVSLSQLTLKVYGTNRGFSVGDTLFVGDEQMRVGGIANSISPSAVDSYNGNTIVSTEMHVGRSINDTTSAVAYGRRRS